MEKVGPNYKAIRRQACLRVFHSHQKVFMVIWWSKALMQPLWNQTLRNHYQMVKSPILVLQTHQWLQIPLWINLMVTHWVKLLQRKLVSKRLVHLLDNHLQVNLLLESNTLWYDSLFLCCVLKFCWWVFNAISKSVLFVSQSTKSGSKMGNANGHASVTSQYVLVTILCTSFRLFSLVSCITYTGAQPSA